MARRDGYRLPTLRLDQLDRILAQYGDCLVRIWLSLWGEPLLNKDLPAMIARCKQRDIWVLLSSNMSVPLKPHAIDCLVRSGLDSIILSIDGATQATYSRYRRGGSLDLALDNVRQLVAAKRAFGSPTPHIYWRYLIFDWNRHEIWQARQFADSLGVDEFGTEPGVLTPETRHDFTPRAPDQEAAQISDRQLGNWRRHAAERRRRYQWFGCDYHYASISINSDGLVHPCCYVVSPAHAIGSATDPVDELRNGPVMRDNRALFAAIGTAEVATTRGHEPCASCSTIDVTCGHIVTQTNFRQLCRPTSDSSTAIWCTTSQCAGKTTNGGADRRDTKQDAIQPVSSDRLRAQQPSRRLKRQDAANRRAAHFRKRRFEASRNDRRLRATGRMQRGEETDRLRGTAPLPSLLRPQFTDYSPTDGVRLPVT